MEEFEEIGHSDAAQQLLLDYQVGVLQDHTLKDAETKDASFQEPTKKETETFVVKERVVAALFYFFMPHLLVGSYFAFRSLARTNDILYYIKIMITFLLYVYQIYWCKSCCLLYPKSSGARHGIVSRILLLIE